MSVVPGTPLGTEEEYIPGANTVLEGSDIYASAVGEKNIREKVVRVNSKTNVPFMLKPGEVVVGRVAEIFEPVALIELQWRRDERGRQVWLPGYAVLHASNVKDAYVKNIHDEVKIGDLVRAKVVKIQRGDVELTVKERELGVLVAYCTKCRARMERKRGGFYCSNCEESEGRKIAEYGVEGFV
ncbi:hypothetical protein DRN67_01785 [Candidatus Micrarchaeota archaeon]|nr:MAG: hypothetical protein DRN67_01785 [Candidatus Micrarchaeota archaeon]